MALLRAGSRLFVLLRQVNPQILSGGDWLLGVHLQFSQEHSTQSLHQAPTPSRLFTLSLILQFSLLSFWNANAHKQLFLCSWHHSLLSSNRGELWHTGCILCWTPGSHGVMTEIWVMLQCSYCNRLSLITPGVSLKCKSKHIGWVCAASVTPAALLKTPALLSVYRMNLQQIIQI